MILLMINIANQFCKLKINYKIIEYINWQLYVKFKNILHQFNTQTYTYEYSQVDTGHIGIMSVLNASLLLERKACHSMYAWCSLVCSHYVLGHCHPYQTISLIHTRTNIFLFDFLSCYIIYTIYQPYHCGLYSSTISTYILEKKKNTFAVEIKCFFFFSIKFFNIWLNKLLNINNIHSFDLDIKIHFI